MNKEVPVSFIIIQTNDDQLCEAIKWIDKQNYSGTIERIVIDNKNNKSFTSAASALNSGARNSKGQILFFMHQDVYLWDVDSVRKIVDFLLNHPDDIVGAAGIAKVDNLPHFDLEMKKKGKRYAWPTNGVPMEAHTLDECLLVMQRKKWDYYPFDEKTCDNWHFYGADICLNNTLDGHNNYIFPLNICHDSYGNSTSLDFKEAAIKIAKKYEGRIDMLRTTCITAKCNEKGVKKFVLKKTIKSKIKKFLKVVGLFKVVEKINNYRKKKKGIFVYEED